MHLTQVATIGCGRDWRPLLPKRAPAFISGPSGMPDGSVPGNLRRWPDWPLKRLRISARRGTRILLRDSARWQPQGLGAT